MYKFDTHFTVIKVVATLMTVKCASNLPTVLSTLQKLFGSGVYIAS